MDLFITYSDCVVTCMITCLYSSLLPFLIWYSSLLPFPIFCVCLSVFLSVSPSLEDVKWMFGFLHNPLLASLSLAPSLSPSLSLSLSLPFSLSLPPSLSLSTVILFFS